MSSSPPPTQEEDPSLSRPSLLMFSLQGLPTSGVGNEVRLRDLETPAFVINRHAFANNCRRVVETAQAQGWKLRPHIKTHKTLEGLQLQQSGSPQITGFVASTLPEVKLLVNHYTITSSSFTSGRAQSILYGVPISAAKLPALWALQERLLQWHSISTTRASCTRIVLLLDHPEQIHMVQHFFSQVEANTEDHFFPVMVKLDTGYHRAGVACDQRGVDLVQAIGQTPCLRFVGLYSHCGHAYDVQDPKILQEIAQTDLDQIRAFLQLLEQQQLIFPNSSTELPFSISVGSTPSLFHHAHPTQQPQEPDTTLTETRFSLERCTHAEAKKKTLWWTGFFTRHPHACLELHPGNYTLYDRQQLYTQACKHVDHIAGRVLTRVIGQYNDDHRPHTLLLDAGATALTKETTPQGGYAAIAGWPSVEVFKLSQEVSMARGSDSSFLDACPLGELLTLLPNHSCLAAACFDKYYIIDDPTCQYSPNAPVVEVWEPVKGW